MSFRALSIAAMGLLASTAIANDWPQWRGPNRDAICTETGLLKSWPKEGPPLLWTTKGLGLGFGTPSVAAGKIFGMGSRDGKDGIWALNELDGKELWFAPIDNPRNVNQNNGPGSTPTYSNGKVFAVSNLGTVACVDAGSGKVEWSKNYKKDFGSSDPSWGFNDSVFVDGDKVICEPGGNKQAVAALEAASGKVLWTVDAGKAGGGAGYSSAVKADIGGVQTYVVVLGQEAGIVGINAETGKLLWQYNNKMVFGSVAQIPTPIVKGDKVWVSTGYQGGSALIQIVPGTDKSTVKELKAYKEDPKNHHGGMILVDGYVYFGRGQNNGIPTCVDFNTGEVVWRAEKNLTGGSGSAAYLYADGLLYIRYENGLLALVSPSPKEDDFKVISSFKLPAPNTPKNTQSWPHPVIANGKLYIRDQNNLYCYNVKASTN